MRKSPLIKAKQIDVETASWDSLSSFVATNLAIKTLAPVAHPTKRLIIRFIRADVEPTAARAVEPAKRPATATSAELKSCWRMLLAAIGIANAISLSQIDPDNISTLFLLFRILLIDTYRRSYKTKLCYLLLFVVSANM